MAHENGDKQRPTKRPHVQGKLDEADPLGIKSCLTIQVYNYHLNH